MYIIQNDRYVDASADHVDAFPTVGVIFDVLRNTVFGHGDLAYVEAFVRRYKIGALANAESAHLVDVIQMIVLPQLPAEEINQMLGDPLNPVALPKPDPLDQLIFKDITHVRNPN